MSTIEREVFELHTGEGREVVGGEGETVQFDMGQPSGQVEGGGG